MLTIFRKLQTSDPEFSRFQDSIANTINQLVRTPILDGNLITGVTVTAAGVNVEHKLNRNMRGWFIVDIDGNVNVWKTDSNDRFFTLVSSGDVMISLWVF